MAKDGKNYFDLSFEFINLLSEACGALDNLIA